MEEKAKSKRIPCPWSIHPLEGAHGAHDTNDGKNGTAKASDENPFGLLDVFADCWNLDSGKRGWGRLNGRLQGISAIHTKPASRRILRAALDTSVDRDLLGERGNLCHGASATDTELTAWNIFSATLCTLNG
jgi:hypothetical protein